MTDWVEEQIVKHEWEGNVDNISYGQILVRCKDCLKRGSYEKCPIGGASERSIYDNWFCADGERRTE